MHWWRKFKAKAPRNSLTEYEEALRSEKVRKYTEEVLKEFHITHALGKSSISDPWYPKTLKAIAILTPREEEE